MNDLWEMTEEQAIEEGVVEIVNLAFGWYEFPIQKRNEQLEKQRERQQVITGFVYGLLVGLLLAWFASGAVYLMMR